MTSTEIATFDQSRLDALAIDLGMDPNAGNTGGLPQLKVNAEHDDDKGIPLPFATFYIKGQTPLVYAKTVKFRPLTMTYQYSKYDAVNNKMESRTVENPSHKQEFIDTNGTTHCGRPGSAVWRALSPEEKKKYEDITAFVNLRGLVTYDGKTASGEEVKVENSPVILRMKGSNYGAFNEAIGDFGKNIPKGNKTWDFWFDIELNKMKNGSVTYFEWKYSFDPLSPVPMDLLTLETLEAYHEELANTNRAIQKDYDAAVNKRSGGRLSGGYVDIEEDF